MHKSKTEIFAILNRHTTTIIDSFDILVTESGMTPLMLVLQNNKSWKINFSDEDIDYIFDNTKKLSQATVYGRNTLMYALVFYPSEHKLSPDRFDKLLTFKNLTQIEISGASPLMYILAHRDTYNFISEDIIHKTLDKLDLDKFKAGVLLTYKTALPLIPAAKYEQIMSYIDAYVIDSDLKNINSKKNKKSYKL